MKMILTDIIKKIHKRKKENNIIPNFVTTIEIRVEILAMTEKELSEMVESGKLETGPTGNSDYFKITKP